MASAALPVPRRGLSSRARSADPSARAGAPGGGPRPRKALRVETMAGEQGESAAAAAALAREGGRGALRVLAVTWNMHGRPPPKHSLAEMLQPGAFDVVAVGTEECMRGIGRSMVGRASKQPWVRRLAAELGGDYREVASRGLVATHLAVFVRASLAPLVSEVETARVATGLGDVVGNKGGVGVGLRVGRTSLLFVNCHLPAHQGNVRQRNQSFHRINSKLALRQRAGAPLAVSERFDRVFWLGDLNYRVNANRRMADDLLARGMLDVMRANDQLGRERRRGRVFAGFAEGELSFAPTYKYDAGTDTYDTSPKRRVPSWTDRVLYMPAGGAVRLLRYDSVASYRTSDHRPVVAEFEVDVVADAAAAAAQAPAQAPAARLLAGVDEERPLPAAAATPPPVRAPRVLAPLQLRRVWREGDEAGAPQPHSAPADGGLPQHASSAPGTPRTPGSPGSPTSDWDSGVALSPSSSSSSLSPTSSSVSRSVSRGGRGYAESPMSGTARREPWPPRQAGRGGGGGDDDDGEAGPADDTVTRTKSESSVCAVM